MTSSERTSCLARLTHAPWPTSLIPLSPPSCALHRAFAPQMGMVYVLIAITIEAYQWFAMLNTLIALALALSFAWASRSLMCVKPRAPSAIACGSSACRWMQSLFLRTRLR